MKDDDVLARRLRYVIGGHCGGIRKRLVVMPSEFLDDTHGVGANNLFVMLGVEIARDLPRIGKLVEGFILESNGRGEEATIFRFRHHRDDG